MDLLIDVMGWIAIMFVLIFTIPWVVALRLKWHYRNDKTKINLSMTLSQSEQLNQMFEHDASFRATASDYEDEYEDEYEDDEEGDNQIVKVAIYQGKAYWLTEEGFKTAPVDEEEEVQYEYSEDVDTINMKSEELETMLEIIDALKEDQ